jgi:hypothetical protein
MTDESHSEKEIPSSLRTRHLEQKMHNQTAFMFLFPQSFRDAQ